MPGPGWYSDPGGGYDVRFFDGQHWTDRVVTGHAKANNPVQDWPPPSDSPINLDRLETSRPDTRGNFLQRLLKGRR